MLSVRVEFKGAYSDVRINLQQDYFRDKFD